MQNKVDSLFAALVIWFIAGLIIIAIVMAKIPITQAYRDAFAPSPIPYLDK